jgi:hypothetical protein
MTRTNDALVAIVAAKGDVSRHFFDGAEITHAFGKIDIFDKSGQFTNLVKYLWISMLTHQVTQGGERGNT